MTTAETALATRQDPFQSLQIDPVLGVLFAPQAVFDRAQGIARLLVDSRLIPDHLSYQAAFIGLDIALRTGQNPLSVLQSMYEVHGKAGWYTSYLVARARQLGYEIRYETTVEGTRTCSWESKGKFKAGTRDFPDMTVTAYVKNDKAMTATVTVEMAEGEGWLSNGKYHTMLQRMLQFRAAGFLIRDYLPEILLGLPTAEELETAPVVVEGTPGATTGGLAALAERFQSTPEDPLLPDIPTAQQNTTSSEYQAPEETPTASEVDIPTTQQNTASSEVAEDTPHHDPEGTAEGVAEVQERARLLRETDAWRTRLGKDGWAEARKRSGVKQRGSRTPIERLQKLADVCEAVYGESHQGGGIVEPVSGMPRQALLDLTWAIEHELGSEVVGSVRVSAKVTAAVQDLTDSALLAYARALYATGWE